MKNRVTEGKKVMDKYDLLIKEYRLLFNDSPPLMGLPYEEAIRRMEKAIKKGKPFSEHDDIPRGTIV